MDMSQAKYKKTKACPFCGAGERIVKKGTAVFEDKNSIKQVYQCNECTAVWKDVFNLKNYTLIWRNPK